MSSDISELAQALSAIERKLLPHLKDGITIEGLMEATKASDAEVKRALMWLSNRNIVTTEVSENKQVILLENGKIAQENGLPEIRILKKVLKKSLLIKELEEKTLSQGEIMASIGVLKRFQAANVNKVDGDMQIEITPAGKILSEKDVTYEPNKLFSTFKSFPVSYDKISADEKKLIDDFTKRKDFLKVQLTKTTTITLTALGKKLISAKIDLSNVEEQLNSKMLKSGEWKKKVFRSYDVESGVPAITGGRRHPLREANNIIRDVYLSMGFQEMSGPWVESSFWCMDSMWIPQDHPARDEQDTFFIDGPADLPDKKLVKKVKDSHEHGGGTGSTGHTSEWSEDIARQRVLRTHSTSTSFRMFGDGIGKEDGKYFYISNNFRNEAIDSTHLAEFLQVEGFIVGDNLTLADLMGVIKEFYARFGIHKIRFKPTFNPYTEPSMEAHFYDDKKKKWYALINSGIFRPEALAPFGIKKTVIAWGMGGSRVAALLNHKNNLRELVGPMVDIEWIANHKTPQSDLEDVE